MATARPGGEIDSFCTRCRMILAHTVLAVVGTRPVRVQCNTCGGQHNYRSGVPEEKPAASGSAKPAAARTTARSTSAKPTFDELLAKKGDVSRGYSPKTAFLLDEVVLHPTFGRGIVSAVRADKIDVTFRNGVKTLVHGRG